MPNNFVHLGSMTAKLFAKQKQGLVRACVRAVLSPILEIRVYFLDRGTEIFPF